MSRSAKHYFEIYFHCSDKLWETNFQYWKTARALGKHLLRNIFASKCSHTFERQGCRAYGAFYIGSKMKISKRTWVECSSSKKLARELHVVFFCRVWANTHSFHFADCFLSRRTPSEERKKRSGDIPVYSEIQGNCGAHDRFLLLAELTFWV